MVDADDVSFVPVVTTANRLPSAVTSY
jgi:hypothetical protein